MFETAHVRYIASAQCAQTMHLPESCTHEYTTDLCVCSSDTGRVHHTHVLTTVELVSAGCLPLGSGRGEATLIRGVRRGHGDSVGTLGQRVQTALKHLNMCMRLPLLVGYKYVFTTSSLFSRVPTCTLITR